MTMMYLELLRSPHCADQHRSALSRSHRSPISFPSSPPELDPSLFPSQLTSLHQTVAIFISRSADAWPILADLPADTINDVK